jgi:tRNA dimethylallyltransferase
MAAAHASPWILALVGPTATGKTALSLPLAEALGTEILCADSRVIYRGLDIGTAKPTAQEQQRVRHHLLDVADPTEVYSVARYEAEATPLLKALLAEKGLAVVTGGTGFYLRALLEASFLPQVARNPALRDTYHQIATAAGPEALWQRLHQADPTRAAAIHPHNLVRVMRALEIVESTGQPVGQHTAPRAYRVLWVGLTVENRDWLRARINARLAAMLAEGWLDEVRDLMRTVGADAEALRVTHGYPEWVAVLQGKLAMDEAKATVCTKIHQYARRQLTWFRRNAAIHWLSVDTLPFDAQMATIQGWIDAYAND